MNLCEWIVCERTSRWAAALRLSLTAQGRPFRLRESRHLAELDAQLADRPDCVVGIEVHRGNFADVLHWLPMTQERFARARYVALVDRSLGNDLEAVWDVLLEAGVQAVATSPRRLGAVLALAAKHAERAAQIDETTPFATQLWASLPWQER